MRGFRVRMIEAATWFVENCQVFDIVTSNAITLIQEVELVSRGYHL